MAVRILAFSGSLRNKSFNQKLVSIAAEGAREAGAEVTVVSLQDFPLPLMDEDLEAEQGMPPKAQELKDLFLTHDGLLISSPEYNSSITPALKNAIDWVSRRQGEEPRLAAYQNKVAGLIAASPSPLGGLRGLVTLRSILGNIGVLVMPDQVTVPQADKAFHEAGHLLDQTKHDAVKKLGAKLAEAIAKLKAWPA